MTYGRNSSLIITQISYTRQIAKRNAL